MCTLKKENGNQFKIQKGQKAERITAVWRNWGFWATLKLVLYLEVGF